MGPTVAIHQPEYFPWPGYLAKARRADVFVLFDQVQFDRSSLQHRAKIANGPDLVWLTIPFVHRFPQRIDELAFADARWAQKHWKSLRACYGRAPGWPAASAALEAFFAASHARVVDAVVASVTLLFAAFGVTTPVVRASSLPVTGDKGELVLGICRHLGAGRYLSGATGASYLDSAAFAAAGIELTVARYTPPAYPRRQPAAIPGLSALDAWLELGAGAPAILETAA